MSQYLQKLEAKVSVVAYATIPRRLESASVRLLSRLLAASLRRLVLKIIQVNTLDIDKGLYSSCNCPRN